MGTSKGTQLQIKLNINILKQPLIELVQLTPATTQESHALAWFFYVLNLLTLYTRNGFTKRLERFVPPHAPKEARPWIA